MIVQDIFRNIDIEKLCNSLVKDYDSFNNGLIKLGREKFQNSIKETIDDLLKIEPVKKEDFIFVCYVDDIISDERYLSPSIIHKEDLIKEKGYIEKQYNDYVLDRDKIISDYSLFLLPREELLGYQFCPYCFEIYDKYDSIASVLFEITWFGLSNEEYDENMNEEENELDRRMKEIETNPGSTIPFDDAMADIFGEEWEKMKEECEVPSEEEINENIKVYQMEKNKHYYYIVKNLLKNSSAPL